MEGPLYSFKHIHTVSIFGNDLIFRQDKLNYMQPFIWLLRAPMAALFIPGILSKKNCFAETNLLLLALLFLLVLFFLFVFLTHLSTLLSLSVFCVHRFCHGT